MRNWQSPLGSQLPVCPSTAHNPERCVVMARATFTGKTTMELAMKELKLQPIRLKSRCQSNTKAKRETGRILLLSALK